VDKAIRRWASNDSSVRRKLRKIDSERIEYVKSLLEEVGFESATALSRSSPIVFSNTGVHWVGRPLNKSEHLAYVHDLHQLMTSRT